MVLSYSKNWKLIHFPNSSEIYAKYSFLKGHREYLWNIRDSDILWEGNNAIVIKHPIKQDMVVKIAKPWKVDDLNIEIKNHRYAFDILEEGRLKWLVSHIVKIPEIYYSANDMKWYFNMERVLWQSVNTCCLRWQFKRRLINENKDFLDSLTDYEVRLLLNKKYDISDKFIDMEIDDYSRLYLMDMLNDKNCPLSWALKYLMDNWAWHADLHPWNIMIDRNGYIYIIDMWRMHVKIN